MSTSEGMGSHVEYYMNQTSFNRSHSMKINNINSCAISVLLYLFFNDF